MFGNVIIGIDGGEGGRDALVLARQLAGPGAQLTLANVWDPRDALVSAATGRPHPAPAGREMLERLRAEFDLDCRIAQLSASSPQRGLQDLAQRVHADLLVVGATHRAGHHDLLGDHARGSLHGAPCAVAVAAAGAGGFADIAVAWDGSPAAKAALEAARDVAHAHDATLHGFSVVPPLPSVWSPELVAYVEVLEDSRGKELVVRRAELAAAGVTEVRAAKGVPEVDLCTWSADVDLIVTGSRGHGAVRRLFLGSTSDALVRGARCSVLAIPRPEPEASADPLEHAMLTVI